ncbi:MAG: hypothetical protein GWM90_17870 [Gemmatimonadetes bacterium]|nr:hypothetical protein [Gemmatimonadota bacterium]NIQ56222.1 hypothetical protein [Gemmatimonadota bacterium]NIX45891.1 hypothetical protein [Gemmatimonadota bacterium]NIY10199.1 hypothetical protein [Gemmatimonadota bacterium]
MEQAQALLRDLRESFAPSYLTLISIIQGVLLGLSFELVSEGRATTGLADPASLLVFNNIVLIALVWNEYRMGSSMFRWIPSLLDAVIPFTVGGLQAALILTTARPAQWLAGLAVLFAASIPAYENMYRRAAEEERNALVLEHNRFFRWFNPVACCALAVGIGALAAVHLSRGSDPGIGALLAVTLLNGLFLLRGEVNWRIVVRAARTAAREQAPTAGAAADRPMAPEQVGFPSPPPGEPDHVVV